MIIENNNFFLCSHSNCQAANCESVAPAALPVRGGLQQRDQRLPTLGAPFDRPQPPAAVSGVPHRGEPGSQGFGRRGANNRAAGPQSLGFPDEGSSGGLGTERLPSGDEGE